MNDGDQKEGANSETTDEAVVVAKERGEQAPVRKSALALLLEFCVNCKNEFDYVKELYAGKTESDEEAESGKRPKRGQDKMAPSLPARAFDEPEELINVDGDDDDAFGDDDDPSFKLTERERKCLKKRLKKQLAKKKSKQILERLRSDGHGETRPSGAPDRLNPAQTAGNAAKSDLFVCKEPKIYARVNEPPMFKTCALAFDNLNSFYRHLFDEHQLNFNLLNSHYGDLTARFGGSSPSAPSVARPIAPGQASAPPISSPGFRPTKPEPRTPQEQPSRPLPIPMNPAPMNPLFPFGHQMPPGLPALHSMASLYSAPLMQQLQMQSRQLANPYRFLLSPPDASSSEDKPAK